MKFCKVVIFIMFYILFFCANLIDNRKKMTFHGKYDPTGHTILKHSLLTGRPNHGR